MKIVVVGGGAGGASFAARMRRLDEKAEITILEKTEETSIASCGLPYFIGGVIDNRDDMQVAKPAFLKQLFNIDVKLNSPVSEINPDKKIVITDNGDIYSYDKLVLATGAKPFVPAIDGIENLPHFVVKYLAAAAAINAYIAQNKRKFAVVVGGGFIGVEVAENLCHLGIKTSLVEMAPQVLMPLDEDMATLIHKEMKRNNLSLYLSDGLQSVAGDGVVLTSGKKVAADMLVLAIGVRPETELAKKAGITLTEKGAVVTNEYMQTNYPDIYACGDSVAVKDFVSGQQTMIALAGPANRQGRLIADHIAGKHPYPYTGTQGTGIVKVFEFTAAFTGQNEKSLTKASVPYEKMLILGNSHAGYYPGAETLVLKVLYGKDGKIFGAQAVGKQGVDKRIDVIATIMRLGGTTADLRDAELCYAPPYSGAKDPVNLIGMAIENVRQGLVEPYFGLDFNGMLVLDVRPSAVYEKEHIDGAINIPAGQIRARLAELPQDKPIMVHCFKGYTSYVVARILMQNGFDNVLSYAGGWNFYKSLKQD